MDNLEKLTVLIDADNAQPSIVEGLLVYGFGEKKTPSAFVSACDKFIYTEVLRAKTDESEAIARKSTKELRQDTRLVTATGLFDTEIREEGPTQHKAIFVRDKKQNK